MSESSELLIIGGCSFGDPKYHGYNKSKIAPWSKLLEKELRIETLNLCKSGYSNDNIANKVMDAVMDNSHKKLTVMVLWSTPNRVNFFDYMYHVTGTYNKGSKNHMVEQFITANKMFGFEFDKAAVQFNLRIMWRLNEFMNNRNIEYYQAHSSSLINNIVWMQPFHNQMRTVGKDKLSEDDKEYQSERLQRLIDETPYNKYYNPNFFTTQSFRSNMKWLPDHTCHLSIEDTHPNEKGHQYILESFLVMKQSQTQVMSSDIIYDGDIWKTEFVYD